jgi:circadian clock protein KaiC
VFRTLSLLAKRGVTALVTVGFEENFTELRFSRRAVLPDRCVLSPALRRSGGPLLQVHDGRQGARLRPQHRAARIPITDAGIEVAGHADRAARRDDRAPLGAEPHK